MLFSFGGAYGTRPPHCRETARPSRSQLSTGELLTLRVTSFSSPYSAKKKARFASLSFLVERTGLEPVTPTLPVSCAPNCANAPKPFSSLRIILYLLRYVKIIFV